MAERKFRLPGIHELNKEQEEVRALPLDGQYLIIGGPGTGKSVVALLRVKKIISNKSGYQFLVYNKLLKRASEQLMNGSFNIESWNRWFSKMYYDLTQQELPKKPSNNSKWKKTDWEQVGDNLTLVETDSLDKQYLVIDEGQDMPQDFYQVLTNLGFENFFVVADQNQQIIEGEHSNRVQIMDSLNIDEEDVIELKSNYRNYLAVAKLARHFYTGNPASPPPDLPVKRSLSAIRPILFEYTDRQFQKIINRILKNTDRNPNKLTGIITPNNRVRKRYFNALMRTEIELENNKPNIATYCYGGDSDIDFSKGGIMVINAQSCKGLEFDIVFLADINKFIMNQQHIDMMKRRFYVIIARAIEQVIMLKQYGEHCPVEEILPKDESLLMRKGKSYNSRLNP